MKWSSGIRFGEGEGIVIVDSLVNGEEYTLELDFTLDALPSSGQHQNDGYGALVNWRTTSSGVIWVRDGGGYTGAMIYNGDEGVQNQAFKVGRQHLTVQKFANGNVMFTIDAGEVETINDTAGNFIIGPELWLFKAGDDPSQFVSGVLHNWCLCEGT